MLDMGKWKKKKKKGETDRQRKSYTSQGVTRMLECYDTSKSLYTEYKFIEDLLCAKLYL